MRIRTERPAQSSYTFIESRKLISAIFFLSAGAFYPFQDSRSCFLSWGLGMSFLSVSLMPMHKKLSPAAQGALATIQTLLFTGAVAMVWKGAALHDRR